jgi:hypothetical protein
MTHPLEPGAPGAAPTGLLSDDELDALWLGNRAGWRVLLRATESIARARAIAEIQNHELLQQAEREAQALCGTTAGVLNG